MRSSRRDTRPTTSTWRASSTGCSGPHNGNPGYPSDAPPLLSHPRPRGIAMSVAGRDTQTSSRWLFAAPDWLALLGECERTLSGIRRGKHRGDDLGLAPEGLRAVPVARLSD